MRLAHVRPSGTLALQRFAGYPQATSLRTMLRHGLPWFGFVSWSTAVWRLKNTPNLLRGLWRIGIARALGIPTHYGALYLTVVRGDGSVERLGLASLRVVTTAGVNFIRDAFLNTTELENMKFHAFGTGTTAEAVGDTALVTEETTQYNPDNTRPTGSQASNGTGDYRTIGTYTPDSGATRAVTEHAIMSQAATGGGTCLDRSKFAAVNLDSTAGDSLQATYDFVATAGG